MAIWIRERFELDSCAYSFKNLTIQLKIRYSLFVPMEVAQRTDKSLAFQELTR